MNNFRKLQINGGRVTSPEDGRYTLELPPVSEGYADAQIDDYGRQKRHAYHWRPGTRLTLKAAFSHPAADLLGTAGFGFWNAPIGDPTVPWPALPQAAWFFFGSPPTDLPLALEGPGRGWFASTINARTPQALALIPTAPLVLLLNQFRPLRRRVWPPLRAKLGITFQPITTLLTTPHTYRLDWEKTGCTFYIDGEQILQTSAAPGGPLGFVCWIDNQYMVLTKRGRFGWGTLSTPHKQTLTITDLHLSPLNPT